MIRFECTKCGKHLRAEDQHVGRRAGCPRCGHQMRVPAPELEPAGSEAAVAEPADSEPAVAEALEPVRRRRVDSGREQPLVARPGKADYEDLVDMTAMVDIVFFLLIFFLVTSMQALNASIPMPVPEAQQAAPQASQPADADNLITVNIDEMDRVWVDGEEIANEYELVAKLYELRDGPGSPDEMLIVGNGNATHGTAVMVHDSGNEVGMSIVRLAIQVDAE